jgi:hypothetical protein
MSRGGGYFLYHHTRDTGGSPVDWCPYKEPLYYYVLLILHLCWNDGAK